MKEIFTAASVEEARAKAAESFGVEEEKITFTVIEEPKKGLFGKIKGEAKVEAGYEPPTKTQAAQAYITELLTKMGIENISVVPTEIENGVNFEIGGDGFTKTIPNLLVAGEAVGGIHGRNRLMGNSLLDIIVFGRDAGKAAAAKAKTVTLGTPNLDHIYQYADMLKEAGCTEEGVSPLLLPHYARHER